MAKAPRTMDFRESARLMIEAGGGRVGDNIFVEHPGVMVLCKHGQLQDQALKLFESLNLYLDQAPLSLLAEFTARITYLSFPAEPDDSGQQSRRLHQLLKQLGHSSPDKLSQEPVSVLVAGLAVETQFELVANKFRIGRTSSSRTAVMDLLIGKDGAVKRQPLYRINGPEAFRVALRQHIRQQIQAHIDWRQSLSRKQLGLGGRGLPKKNWQELVNMSQPGNKAAYQVVAGDSEFWHKKLTRRLADFDGAEHELRLVCARIYAMLRRLEPALYQGPYPSEDAHESRLQELLAIHNYEPNPDNKKRIEDHLTKARELLAAGHKVNETVIYEQDHQGFIPHLLCLAMAVQAPSKDCSP